MNFSISIDWKFVVAFGLAVTGTIFSLKMNSDSAEKVSTHVVDACKEFAIAKYCGG